MDTLDTDPGLNSLIIRTWSGMELVSAALAAGYLKVGKSVDPEYMGGTQPHQVAKKKNVAARYEGLKQAGRLTPQTNDLRLKQLSQTLSKDEYKNQKQGAYNRAMSQRSN